MVEGERTLYLDLFLQGRLDKNKIGILGSSPEFPPLYYNVEVTLSMPLLYKWDNERFHGSVNGHRLVELCRTGSHCKI